MSNTHNKDINYVLSGAPLTDAPLIVWAHGWGQDGAAFAQFCEAFPGHAHLRLDFPGFGASRAPDNVWGTEDYADATEQLLTQLAGHRRVIWVGHSFGGRVGLQMASRHAPRLRGLCLIAGAGLQPKRSWAQRLKVKIRIALFKALRKLAAQSPWAARLKSRFGSADYQKTSGTMRGVFVRAVNEDLSPLAAQIAVPTLLIYGDRDTETPPDFGHRLAALIKGAELHILPGQDHYTVLGEGRHIVIKRLKHFMDRL